MTNAATPAPIIVTATMGAADFAWADQLRRTWFPPERNQVPAHITLFHHLPPTCEGELKSLLGRLVRARRPVATVDRLLDLGGGVALHVESAGLLDMRDEIAERFHGMLSAQDRQRPRLHITVQNKVSSQEARQTMERLMADFRPRVLTLHGLACWRYAGGPWAAIGHYPFRG